MLSNTNIIILSCVILFIIALWFINKNLLRISKDYQENINLYLKDILSPNEDVLLLVSSKKYGFYAISLFLIAFIMFFIMPYEISPSIITPFKILFLILGLIYLLFIYFYEFYTLLIVTNKRLIYKSLFKVGKLQTVYFDEIKEVRTTMSNECLSIIKFKGRPLKIANVSDVYKKSDLIRKIVFSQENVKELYVNEKNK